MGKALRIKEAARERGMPLNAIAKKLGMYPSNISAIAAGTRGVSLRVLKKICYILDCSIDELMADKEHPAIFKDRKLLALIGAIERRNHDGIDKTWVDRVMLAQLAHYRAAEKTL